MLPRLGWPLPGVFAHRCGGALAPENTLAGLHIAAGLGLRAVEFDVMLSADGSPWLLHDEALARTTNGDGLLCETPDSALCLLDAGAYRRRSPVADLDCWPTSRSSRLPVSRNGPARSLPAG